MDRRAGPQRGPDGLLIGLFWLKLCSNGSRRGWISLGSLWLKQIFLVFSVLRFYGSNTHVQTVEIRFKRPNMAGNGCSIIIFENALEWMIFFEVKTFSFCVFLLIWPILYIDNDNRTMEDWILSGHPLLARNSGTASNSLRSLKQ